jgi:hypothetical protein
MGSIISTCRTIPGVARKSEVDFPLKSDADKLLTTRPKF